MRDESQGWCAPATEHQLIAPPPLDYVEFPAMSARRGGIQWPMDIQTVVTFHIDRLPWHRPRRWAVRMRVAKSWTLNGQDGGKTVSVIIARTFRHEAACALRSKLAGASP